MAQQKKTSKMEDALKQEGFIAKVLAYTKGGDEAKLARFEAKLKKYFDKQISYRTEIIDNLKDKISDNMEVLNETVLNINLDKINSTDSTEDYCSDYVGRLDEELKIIDDFSEKIDELEGEISRLEELKSLIFS